MELNEDYLKEMKEKEEREAKLREEQKDKPEKKVRFRRNDKNIVPDIYCKLNLTNWAILKNYFKKLNLEKETTKEATDKRS